MGPSVSSRATLENVRALSAYASLIDLAEGNRPQRDIEAADMVIHKFEEHTVWLEPLGIPAE
jgi:hypothetical protein